MSSIKDKIREKNRTVKIFMNCGRMTIDSSTHEWINPTTKIKKEGIVLQRKSDKDSFVELDLGRKEDVRVYERFKEWIAEDSDWRIKWFNVYEVKSKKNTPPFTWWESTSDKKLLDDVYRTLEHIEERADRERFVEHCIDFEQSREAPRKKLINKLLDIDLDVKPVDEMEVPEAVSE